jgi:hypothetical protein
MLVMLLTAMALASGAESTMYWERWQLEESDVPVAQAGEYRVWAWAETGGDTGISIADKRLAVHPKRQRNQPDYLWVQAGSVTLDAHPVQIKLEAGVMAVALSTNEEFDPKRVMGDIRVFDTPRGVEDRRARTARHTDTVFTMPEFDSREEWERYAARLRRRILLSSGLLPLPERTPLNTKIFDRIEHPDYTVEKVHFEAWPGYLVTGNLYRPVGSGPFPAVVSPHGHWEKGRLEDSERGSVPGRGITLARMGIVTFNYDMIGYVDSRQFDHNWGGEREKLWGLHPFAMQLWASIRAVDFIETLPEVDRERIGCTGASGGGTQTFVLMAVDPRIKAAAPVNMISSTMQGGCLCENAPILRLDNSNMEIGALMAPRPLLLVSATGDWTRETPRVEYPAIRSIYALYEAEDRIESVQIDAGHNYNQPSREAVYRFFGKWLLNRDDMADYTEPPFTVEEPERLRVFPGDKAPENYPAKDEVIASVIAATRAKWETILPATGEDPAGFRAQYGGLLAEVLGVQVPAANELRCERIAIEQRPDYAVERWVIGRAAVGDAIPALFYRGYGSEKQPAVLVVHGAGKAALANLESGGPGPLVQGFIDQGKAVLCIDAFLLGEHHAPDNKTDRLRVGRFMDTFQPTDTGERIQDVLTALAFLRARRDLAPEAQVVGLEQAGLWCLFAAAVDASTGTVVADLNQFPIDDDDAWVDQYYVPCLRAIGDLRTAVAMIRPDRNLLLNGGAHAAHYGIDAEAASFDLNAFLTGLK